MFVAPRATTAYRTVVITTQLSFSALEPHQS
jgi:hypothetical protein